MLYTFSEALEACGFNDKLKYDKELEVKNNAIALFFEMNKIMACPKAVIASPMPLGYRTTTKRRAKIGRNGFSFGVDEAPITEPREHQEIYSLVEQKLQSPPYRPLAEALNWVILRGSYTNRTIIFNVRELNAPIVRKLKQMAEHLQRMPKPVTAAHVYVAKSSDYYLEMDQPTDSLSFKQLYGPKELALKLDGFSLKYPVTGFSQINESQVRNMLSAAKSMAKLDANTDFMDLYCGYGLFSFGMGEEAREVLGVEWTGESIECAKRSANFLKRNAHFIAGRIDSNFINKLPKAKGNEVILLDPPRKGTLPGVIESLAKRKPRRVVHIFCGTDEIPRSIKEWDKSGYKIEEVQPLDMFPKVRHMETLISLVPKA
ncbi:MAG: class I SAM-dependent RNA methyltransferase [Bacteroidia bacterium]|nr:class I SAM-dependent RNA methyltransferase [Bacteroidia bacterium]